jgi:hypothetical protein
MTLCAVLILEARTSPLVAQVTPAWLARCASACGIQLNRDVSPIYGGGSYGVRVGSGPTDVQPGELVFALLDTLPNAPGAIAYHDVTGANVPVAFLALSTCKTLDDVSTAISHELVETGGDLSCNLWADDGQGHEWARELCDAVESNAYPIDLGDGQPPVKVSDFLLPGFFGSSAPGPYSFAATLSPAPSPAPAMPSAAFATATGGYQLQRTSGGNETQVTAVMSKDISQVLGPRGFLAVQGKHHWSSRAARRGLARI